MAIRYVTSVIKTIRYVSLIKKLWLTQSTCSSTHPFHRASLRPRSKRTPFFRYSIQTLCVIFSLFFLSGLSSWTSHSILIEFKSSCIESVFLRCSWNVLVSSIETFADYVVFEASWFCVVHWSGGGVGGGSFVDMAMEKMFLSTDQIQINLLMIRISSWAAHVFQTPGILQPITPKIRRSIILINYIFSILGIYLICQRCLITWKALSWFCFLNRSLLLAKSFSCRSVNTIVFNLLQQNLRRKEDKHTGHKSCDKGYNFHKNFRRMVSWFQLIKRRRLLKRRFIVWKIGAESCDGLNPHPE